VSAASESDVHIAAIRRALTDGNAAVMVGSGFSLNAEGGSQLATWPAMAKALWKDLNPTWAVENPGKELPPFSASQVTELGEQYARVFSTPALEDLLKRLVPDDKIQPGRLHRLLLQLPWTEILTTNYDTLLERSAEDIVERGHFTVTCREDIPKSKILGRRRIVKLHGSFPSQRPFIFTEEDYRKYPETFAPFVNLVRQSMLENVFCLVGFSGDDPNFLHWIGWVRDVLDKHALPIYLLLSHAPSMGVRSLLEARKVTPVVLPQPYGCDSDAYLKRYESLFKNLAESSEPDDLQWSKSFRFSNNDYIEASERPALMNRFVAALQELQALTSQYPGWLVAPKAVRRNFERVQQQPSVSALRYPAIYKDAEQRTPCFAVAILALHVWNIDVTLGVLDDNIAKIGLRLLAMRDDAFVAASDDDKKLINQLGIDTAAKYRDLVKQLALGLLRWARECQNQTEFLSVASRAVSLFPGDALVSDTVAHETILLALYQGELIEAKRLVAEWRPRNTDPYMAIRRGALLAELGDLPQAMDACVAALQVLRREQKVRADKTKCLSEEAWAYRVIGNITTAQDFFGRGAKNDDQLIEESERRVTQLAAVGYDVLREMQELVAELDTGVALPSSPINLGACFEVGQYDTHQSTTHPIGFDRKVDAAFAWLALADRVGLTPRVGDVSFDATSYTQAAWWTQYRETPRRLLGVATRLLSLDVLKPKDMSKPPHVSGWLSRYQIARLDFDLTMDVKGRSLAQTERAIGSALNDRDVERFASFHLEVASRLSIRTITAEDVADAFRRGVDLYIHPRVRKLPKLWQALTSLLARNFEAAAPTQRADLLALMTTIPVGPVQDDNRSGEDWLLLREFFDKTVICDPTGPAGQALLQAAAQHIEILTSWTTASPAAQATRSWGWLFLMDALKLLSSSVRARIVTLAANVPQWPDLPGFLHNAAMIWAEDRKDLVSRYREWVLGLQLSSFRQPSMMMLSVRGSERSWGLPADNGLLRAWHRSTRQTAWSNGDTQKILYIIKQWWDAEWPLLFEDSKQSEHLKEALLTRLNLLDEVLSVAVPMKKVVSSLAWIRHSRWLQEVILESSVINAKFLRTRATLALASGDVTSLINVHREVTWLLSGSSNGSDALDACRIVKGWALTDITVQSSVIDALAAVIATRRSPMVIWALTACREIARCKPSWLTPARLSLIDSGLDAMLVDADYKVRPSGTSISDEDVPTLRLHSILLSKELQRSFPKVDFIGAQKWIEVTDHDPLPEARFALIEDSEAPP